METLQAPKASTPSISPINTPSKFNYGPAERRQPIGADAETLSNHADTQANLDADTTANGDDDAGGSGGDHDDSVLAEEMASDMPEGHAVPTEVNGPADNSGIDHREDIPIHR